MANRREVGQQIFHITGTVTIINNYGTRPECVAAQAELAERTQTGCVSVHPESEGESPNGINDDDHQTAVKTVEAVNDPCRARTAEEITWLSESTDTRSLNVDSLIIESEPTSINIFADNRNNDTSITQVKRLVHCPQRHATTQTGLQEEANSSITQVKQLQGQGQKRHITTQTELPKEDKLTQTNISDLKAEENQQNVFFSDSELFGDCLTEAERSNPDDVGYEVLPTNEGTVERLNRNDDYECYEYGGNIRLNRDEVGCYENDDSDGDYSTIDNTNLYENVPINVNHSPSYLNPVHYITTNDQVTASATGENTYLKTDDHVTPGATGENTYLKTDDHVNPGATGENTYLKTGHQVTPGAIGENTYLKTGHQVTPGAIGENTYLKTGHQVTPGATGQNTYLKTGHQVTPGATGENTYQKTNRNLPPLSSLPSKSLGFYSATGSDLYSPATLASNNGSCLPPTSETPPLPQYNSRSPLRRFDRNQPSRSKHYRIRKDTYQSSEIKKTLEHLPKSCNEQQQNYVDVVKTTATTLSKSDTQRLVAGESTLI